jgi:hypothetical protein
MHLKLLATSLSLALAISLGVNIYQYTTPGLAISQSNSSSSSEVVDRFDERYINMALEYWARKTNTTVERAKVGRIGKVIYFPTEACVSLDMEAGGAGGVPIYCFDLQNDRLTRSHDDVE